MKCPVALGRTRVIDNEMSMNGVREKAIESFIFTASHPNLGLHSLLLMVHHSLVGSPPFRSATTSAVWGSSGYAALQG